MPIRLAQIAVAAALVLPLPAGAQPITLKLSFFSSDRSTIYQCRMKPFIDAINSEAADQVRVDVSFGTGTSTVMADQAKMILDGTVDIGDIPVEESAARFPDRDVLQLPGLFKDQIEGNRVYTRLVASGALTGYSDFIILGAFMSGNEIIHSRQPVTILDALNGQSIRVNDDIEAAALRKLGAKPLRLPLNQTMERLAAGTVDAVTVPVALVSEFGFGRLATNHYNLELGGVPSLLAMNRRRFESFPAPAQTVIRKYSGLWLADQSASCFEAKGAEADALLRADPRRKVTQPTAADQAIVDRIFAEVTEEWAAQSPRNRELLALVRAEIAKERNAK